MEYLDVVEEEQGIMTARNEEGEGRANLANFRPGQVLTGTVTEISIIHGLKVDIGAEYDVIIPMRQDAPWKTIAKDGSLEAVFMKEVPLTIAQVKDPYRYRWPLVGFLHEGPDLPGMIDAYDFKVPICLYEGDQLGAVAKEVGRKYVRAKFYMEIEKEPTVFPHMEEELAEGGKPDPEAKFDEFMMEVRKDLGL